MEIISRLCLTGKINIFMKYLTIPDFKYEIIDLDAKESIHQYLSINIIEAYNTCSKLVF